MVTLVGDSSSNFAQVRTAKAANKLPLMTTIQTDSNPKAGQPATPNISKVTDGPRTRREVAREREGISVRLWT